MVPRQSGSLPGEADYQGQKLVGQSSRVTRAGLGQEHLELGQGYLGLGQRLQGRVSGTQDWFMDSQGRADICYLGREEVHRKACLWGDWEP